MIPQLTQYEPNGAKKARQLIYQFDIGGQIRIFDFGMYCWELFCEKMNIGPDEVANSFNGITAFKAMRTIIYCGIESYALLNDRPVDITEKDVVAWINEAPEVIEDIVHISFEIYYGTLSKDNCDS